MNVRLVSHSQSTQEFVDSGIANAQELIVFCAQVSDPANQFNTETSERLMQYLIKYAHWEPLDKVSACVEITTTRSIARQILRHRSEHYARAIDLMIGKEQAGDLLLDDTATRRLHMHSRALTLPRKNMNLLPWPVLMQLQQSFQYLMI